MNPAELKKLLKPIVKELIKESVQEVLLKEGLLSAVVSEVVKGMSTNLVTETRNQAPVAPRGPSEEQKLQELKRQKKQLLDAIGKDSFRGVDIFEGVNQKDLPPEESSASSMGSPLAGTSPNDPGIDISSIVAMGGKAWKQLLK